MSNGVPTAVYRPGDSILHRSPVGAKLTALAAVSSVVVICHGPAVTTSAALLAVFAMVLAQAPVRLAANSLRSVTAIAGAAALVQWWWYDAATAAETLVDLLALAALALVVTVTTPINAMIDIFTRALRCLGRVGLDPDRVALTIALAIGALPATMTIARETRAAAAARGMDRSLRAHLTPFVVRVVARAHQTGDALSARGIDDPVESKPRCGSGAGHS